MGKHLEWFTARNIVCGAVKLADDVVFGNWLLLAGLGRGWCACVATIHLVANCVELSFGIGQTINASCPWLTGGISTVEFIARSSPTGFCNFCGLGIIASIVCGGLDSMVLLLLRCCDGLIVAQIAA